MKKKVLMGYIKTQERFIKLGKVMKANEIMIEDWVLCTYNQRNYKVAEIKTVADDELKIVVNNDYVPLVFRCIYFEPIPLTAEILEKNGIKWLCTEPSGRKTYCCNEPVVQCTYIPNSGRLINVGACGSIKVRFVEISKTKYVHELQHALRLCGIEKEIIL